MQLPQNASSEVVGSSLESKEKMQAVVHSFSPVRQRSGENLTNSSQARQSLHAPNSPQFCVRHTEPFISTSPQVRKEAEAQSPILLPPHLTSHYQSDLPTENTYLQKPGSRIFHIENASSAGSFVSGAGHPQQTTKKSILHDKRVQ